MSANLFKSVKIKDREFSIKKFDAKTGAKLGRLVLVKAAPAMNTLGDIDNGKGKKSKAQIEKENREFYNILTDVLKELSDDDMDMVIDYCMRVCYEKFPDKDPVPVMDKDGTFLIEDVEYNLALTLRLCIEAIIWGASDFFGEDGLSLIQSLT